MGEGWSEKVRTDTAVGGSSPLTSPACSGNVINKNSNNSNNNNSNNSNNNRSKNKNNSNNSSNSSNTDNINRNSSKNNNNSSNNNNIQPGGGTHDGGGMDTSIAVADDIMLSRSAETMRASVEPHAQQSRQSRARSSRCGAVQAGGRRGGGAGVGGDSHHHHSSSGSRAGGRKVAGASGAGGSGAAGNLRKSHSCTAQCEQLRPGYTFDRPGRSLNVYPSMYAELLRSFEADGAAESTSVSGYTDRELAVLMSEALSDDDEEGDTPALSDDLLMRIFSDGVRYLHHQHPGSQSGRQGMVSYPHPSSNGPAPLNSSVNDVRGDEAATSSRAYRMFVNGAAAGGSSSNNHQVRPQPPSPVEDSLGTTLSEISLPPSASATLVSSSTTTERVVSIPQASCTFPDTKPNKEPGAAHELGVCCSSSRETDNHYSPEDRTVAGASAQTSFASAQHSLTQAPENEEGNASSINHTCCHSCVDSTQDPNDSKDKTSCSEDRPGIGILSYGFLEKTYMDAKKSERPDEPRVRSEQDGVGEDTKEITLTEPTTTTQTLPPPCLSKPRSGRIRADKRVPLAAEIADAISRAIAQGELAGDGQETKRDAGKSKTTSGETSDTGVGQLDRLQNSCPLKSSKFPYEKRSDDGSGSQPLEFFRVSAARRECKVKNIGTKDADRKRQSDEDLKAPGPDEARQNVKKPVRSGPLYRKAQQSTSEGSAKPAKGAAVAAETPVRILSPPPNSPTRCKAGITFSEPVATYVTDCNTNMSVSGSVETLDSLNLGDAGLGKEPAGTARTRVKAGADGDTSDCLTGELTKDKDSDKETGTAISSSTSSSKENFSQTGQPKPTLNSHPSILLKPREYLGFYSFLKSKKPVKKEVRQPKTKIFKLQRMMTDIGGGGTPTGEFPRPRESEDVEPEFPRGREVPPGWKPGQHASHPITRISAEYGLASQKPSKAKKHVWKKARSPRKPLRGSQTSHAVRQSASDSSVVSVPRKEKKKRRTLRRERWDRSSSDDLTLLSSSEFERKRQFYERQQRSRSRQEHGGKAGRRSRPKKVTEQVKFLKTIDDICNAAEEEQEDAGPSLSFSDSNVLSHTDNSAENQTMAHSLAKYYTKKVAMTAPVAERVEKHHSLTSVQGVRILRANVHVPSAMSLERLQVIGPSTPQGSHWRGSGLAGKGGQSHPSLPATSAKWPDGTTLDIHGAQTGARRLLKKSAKFTPDWVNSTRSLGYSDYREAWDELRANYVENAAQQASIAPRSAHTSQAAKREPPSNEGKRSPAKSEKGGSQKKTSATKLLAGLKEKSSNYKLNQLSKLPPPPNRSEEDTWCYSVNAMLLRAKQAMAYEHKKGTHRFPRHNSAAVVSPVIEQKATSSFLKTLLKQDAEELRRSKAGGATATSAATAAGAAPSDAGLKQQRDRIRNAVSKASVRKTFSPGRTINNSNRASPSPPRRGQHACSGSPSWLAQETSGPRTPEQRASLPIRGSPNAPQTSFSACRIQKPLDLKNPHNRDGAQRMKLPSKQSALKQKQQKQQQAGKSGPTYILDQTLRYFDYPYMTNCSITPLYSNSNNNALPRGQSANRFEAAEGKSSALGYSQDEILPKIADTKICGANVSDVHVSGRPSKASLQPRDDLPVERDSAKLPCKLLKSHTAQQQPPQRAIPCSLDHTASDTNQNAIIYKNNRVQLSRREEGAVLENDRLHWPVTQTGKQDPGKDDLCGLDQRSLVESLLKLERKARSPKQQAEHTSLTTANDLAEAQSQAEAAYVAFLVQTKETETAELRGNTQHSCCNKNRCSPAESHGEKSALDTNSNSVGKKQLEMSELDTVGENNEDIFSFSTGQCVSDIINVCKRTNDASLYKGCQKCAQKRKSSRKKQVRHARCPLEPLKVVNGPTRMPLAVYGSKKKMETRSHRGGQIGVLDKSLCLVPSYQYVEHHSGGGYHISEIATDDTTEGDTYTYDVGLDQSDNHTESVARLQVEQGEGNAQPYTVLERSTHAASANTQPRVGKNPKGGVCPPTTTGVGLCDPEKEGGGPATLCYTRNPRDFNEITEARDEIPADRVPNDGVYKEAEHVCVPGGPDNVNDNVQNVSARGLPRNVAGPCDSICLSRNPAAVSEPCTPKSSSSIKTFNFLHYINEHDDFDKPADPTHALGQHGSLKTNCSARDLTGLENYRASGHCTVSGFLYSNDSGAPSDAYGNQPADNRKAKENFAGNNFGTDTFEGSHNANDSKSGPEVPDPINPCSVKHKSNRDNYHDNKDSHGLSDFKFNHGLDGARNIHTFYDTAGNSVSTDFRDSHKFRTTDGRADSNCSQGLTNRSDSQVYGDPNDPDYLHISGYSCQQPAETENIDSTAMGALCRGQSEERGHHFLSHDQGSTYSTTSVITSVSLPDGLSDMESIPSLSQDESLRGEESTPSAQGGKEKSLVSTSRVSFKKDNVCSKKSASLLSCETLRERHAVAQGTTGRTAVTIPQLENNSGDSPDTRAVRPPFLQNSLGARRSAPSGDSQNEAEQKKPQTDPSSLQSPAGASIVKEEAAAEDYHVDFLRSPDGGESRLSCDRASDGIGPPPPTPRDSQPGHGYSYSRDYLRSLRLTDLTSAFIRRRDKLRAGLEAVATVRYYMPAFTVTKWTLAHASPLVVKVHFCSSDLARPRRRVDKDGCRLGRQAPLSVFYTQDTTGAPVGLYAVRWVESGLYSLLHRDVLTEQDHLGSAKLGALLEHPVTPNSYPPRPEDYPLLLLGAPLRSRRQAQRELALASETAWRSLRISALVENFLGVSPHWDYHRYQKMVSRVTSAPAGICPRAATGKRGAGQAPELLGQDSRLREMLADDSGVSIDHVVNTFKALAQRGHSRPASTSTKGGEKEAPALQLTPPREHEAEGKLQDFNLGRSVAENLTQCRETQPQPSGWRVSVSGMALPGRTCSSKPAEEPTRYRRLPNIAQARSVVDSWRRPATDPAGGRQQAGRHWWWTLQPDIVVPDQRRPSILGVVGKKSAVVSRRHSLPPVRYRLPRGQQAKMAAGSRGQDLLDQRDRRRAEVTLSGAGAVLDAVTVTQPDVDSGQLAGWEWPGPVLPPPFPDILRRRRKASGRRLRLKLRVRRAPKSSPFVCPKPVGVGQTKSGRRKLKGSSSESSLRSYSSAPSASSTSDDEEAPPSRGKRKGPRPRTLADIFKQPLAPASLPYSAKKRAEEVRRKRQQRGRDGEEEDEVGDAPAPDGQAGGDSLPLSAPTPPRGKPGSPLTTPSACSGETGEVAMLVEYDMLSDADEARELWSQCFPPVCYSRKKRRWRKAKFPEERIRLLAKSAVLTGLGSLA